MHYIRKQLKVQICSAYQGQHNWIITYNLQQLHYLLIFTENLFKHMGGGGGGGGGLVCTLWYITCRN